MREGGCGARQVADTLDAPERGAFRTEYTGATLREHPGLPLPVWKG
ncbi:hypothetical protein ABZ419_29890 [Streptomyces cinnamoneus]